jgi:DNA (cytosine-5)-methyltransferase 1
MKIFNVASLFAGVGGIDLAFQQASNNNKQFKLVVANEFDEFACVTYRHNFNHALVEEDITKLFPSSIDYHTDDYKSNNHLFNQRAEMLKHRIDILTAGFPCQAFSIAGHAKGFDDHRGNLFLNIIEYIKALESTQGKPRILFLENVKNLRAHDKGRTFTIIKEKIEELGYKLKFHVLNTMDYTKIPQNRERIFIIGFLNGDDYNKFTFFDNLKNFKLKLSVDERISINSNILDNSVDKKYYYTQEKYPHYFMNEIDNINLNRSITEKNQFYQLRRGLHVRKNQSNVCPTLTANMGTGGHNVPLILNSKGIRKLTPKETFKIQGFPIGDGYSLPEIHKGRKIGDSKFYKQAGNSVTVPLVNLLAKQILEIL